ncbi:MAG TPA: ATP-binding protein [Spirochaetales bacterium]|nr:ATP-binding protein [Spirochaetales bacterium]HPM71797.1 ATP-binding protein [Spirochaetales bacterium]
MRRARPGTRTFTALFLLSAAAVAIMAASSVVAMRRLQRDSTLSALSQAATALANALPGALSGARLQGSAGLAPFAAAVDGFCDAAAAGTSLRVSAIAADGSVLGDSGSDPGKMDNHATRPEFAEALLGRPTTIIRRSATLGLEMAYAAAPIRYGGSVAGALRMAMGAPDLGDELAPFLALSLALATATIAATAVASRRIGAAITMPLRALVEAAGDWSAGRLDRRVRHSGDPAFEPLADAMNAMAAELAARTASTERQQRELGAILDAMGEAVLSTDGDLAIRLANPRARELLGPGAQPGRGLLEATGNASLETLALRAAAGELGDRVELALYGAEARQLLVSGAPLPLEGDRPGAVLVLSDITRLKRLERVRTDFVANVSHELRTPITLIKGFAETLEADPSEAGRFIGIIKRHADRMAAIVDDLLTLARLEGPERGRLETREVLAGPLIERAIESLGDKPARRRAIVAVDAPVGLSLRADEGLLEQALVNLLDNAVKYSPEGGEVNVEAASDGDDVVFTVRDHGPGVPAKDAARLFERFYRVDRARSRELGGTGLGLAIVRHIALAHGGDASVATREGSGCAFTLRVPRRPPEATEADSVQPASPDGDTARTSS